MGRHCVGHSVLQRTGILLAPILHFYIGSIDHRTHFNAVVTERIGSHAAITEVLKTIDRKLFANSYNFHTHVQLDEDMAVLTYLLFAKTTLQHRVQLHRILSKGGEWTVACNPLHVVVHPSNGQIFRSGQGNHIAQPLQGGGHSELPCKPRLSAFILLQLRISKLGEAASPRPHRTAIFSVLFCKFRFSEPAGRSLAPTEARIFRCFPPQAPARKGSAPETAATFSAHFFSRELQFFEPGEPKSPPCKALALPSSAAHACGVPPQPPKRSFSCKLRLSEPGEPKPLPRGGPPFDAFFRRLRPKIQHPRNNDSSVLLLLKFRLFEPGEPQPPPGGGSHLSMLFLRRLQPETPEPPSRKHWRSPQAPARKDTVRPAAGLFDGSDAFFILFPIKMRYL